MPHLHQVAWIGLTTFDRLSNGFSIDNSWTVYYSGTLPPNNFTEGIGSFNIGDPSTNQAIVEQEEGGNIDVLRTGAPQPRPVGFPPGTGGPPPPTNPAFVALGDSFSSGEGAPGVNGYERGTDVGGVNKCHRSDRSYSALDARLRGVPSTYIFRACSGAVVEDFFSPFPQNHPELNLRNPTETTPQLDWIDANTKLVTLTIGGNNAHFPDVMQYCGGRAFYQPSCKARFGEAVDQAIANLAVSSSGRVNDNVPDLLSAIHHKASGAKVFVVGYPRFFPVQRTAACYTGVPFPFRFFTGSDMRWINQEVVKINAVIKKAAMTQGFVYVDTYDAFRGHELCTLHPYFNSVRLDLQESYHPNVDGQKRLAAVLKKSLSQ